jgi:senataxin
VVLVGDPQQLPATVLSAAARGGLFQRSLFERLTACGARSLLLSLQYRMHPAIRAFPSAYFYQGRLQDAPAVTHAPDEPFYALNPLLAPYAFFDVAGGRESRRGASNSVRNEAEAALAAALYGALRATLPAGAAAGRVGVVTPYREQKKALAEAFCKMLGDSVLGEVSIDTVDSFQGQERDVIILSLVRAHAPGAAAAPAGDAAGGGSTRATLGFVTDVRRMNVALTRARRALWVLGNAASLRAAPQWAALIDDAVARGAVVQRATAHRLFPAIAPPPPGGDAEDEDEQAPRRHGGPRYGSLDDPGAARGAGGRVGAAATAMSWGGFAQLPPAAPPPVAAAAAQLHVVPPGGAFTSAAAAPLAAAPPPPLAFVPEGGMFEPVGRAVPVPPRLPPPPQFPPAPPPLLYEEI